MRKIVVYIIILCALSACVTYDRTTEQVAETTLRTADSLENALQTYADIIALQDAAETFRAKGQTAKEARVLYHLGKAYLAEQQDSLAFECFSQAANEFLYLSDSIYYPLSVLELSLIAERKYREEGDATMLQAIRTIHREVIQTKTTNARKRNILIVLLTLVVVGSGIAVYAIYRSKKTFTKSVKREDLERNIALVLSQGRLQTALHWDDYQQFCSTANAYLYDAVDKLQAIQPELSEQDVRFLVLVLLDLPAKEIADIMNLSQNSISNKKTRTAQKLGTIAANLREKLISITLKTKEKMKTKVLFSALCLLISISVCAGNKKPTVSKITQNGQEKTVYVMTSDGGQATVTTTTSSSKGRKISSTTITKQGNGNAASVLASDGESLIDIDLSDLPKLKAEEMPEYPGGMSAMMTFIMENIKYPEDAKKAGKDGRVICSFIINKEGKVTEVHVAQSSGTQSLDDEAVRLVSLMPDWKPGKEKGEPVNILYSIPVVFKLK